MDDTTNASTAQSRSAHDPLSSGLACTYGDALTPCPCCGRRGLLTPYHNVYGADAGTHFVWCLNCGHKGEPYPTHDAALASVGVGPEAGPALPPEIRALPLTHHWHAHRDGSAALRGYALS